MPTTTTFTIDSDNNLAAHDSPPGPESGDCFTSLPELRSLAGGWPVSRLVEVWNSIPGHAPVKKFTNRKVAETRIWKAIQSLAVAAQPPAVAPKARKTSKRATPKPRAQRAAAVAAAAPEGRDGSKKAMVLGMIQTPAGATLAEIMKATGWQAHSVRGFVAGALGKKLGMNVESFKNEQGERAYRAK